MQSTLVNWQLSTLIICTNVEIFNQKIPKKKACQRKLEKIWNIQGHAIFQHENFKIKMNYSTDIDLLKLPMHYDKNI